MGKCTRNVYAAVVCPYVLLYRRSNLPKETSLVLFFAISFRYPFEKQGIRAMEGDEAMRKENFDANLRSWFLRYERR